MTNCQFVRQLIQNLISDLGVQRHEQSAAHNMLQLIPSKCVPALLYGLDACPLNKNNI